MGSSGSWQAGWRSRDLLLLQSIDSLFALDIYTKNEKTNLSEADKRSLKRLLPILVTSYLKRS
jgi:hypothetical protein